MSDIVERLREEEWPGEIPLNVVDMIEDAAEEIESLRAEIARLRAGGCARDQGTTQYCAEAAKLAAENERLRAWNAEIALNARHFAEALRKIAEHPTGGVGCNPEGFVKEARAALEGNDV